MEIDDMQFNYFPDDIKLEVFKQITDATTNCLISGVCKNWYNLVNDNYVWKHIFFCKYGGWSFDTDDRMSDDSSDRYWKEKYIYYYTKGWQFSASDRGSTVELSNCRFTASCRGTEGNMCVRADQCMEYPGTYYFEVYVEPLKGEDIEFLNRGKVKCLAVGVASNAFNCKDTGLTRINKLTSRYFNDGSVSFRDEVHSAMKYRSFDRVGVEVNFIDEDNCNIVYYINSEKSVEKTIQLESPLYPFITFIGGLFPIFSVVEIKSRFKDFPKVPMTEAQIAYRNIYKAKQMIRTQVDLNIAAELLTSCVNFNPSWKSARKSRSMVYKKLDQLELALQDLSKVVELEPTSWRAYSNRVDVYLILARHDSQALDDINSALSLNTTYYSLFRVRGFIEEKLGHYDMALADYTKALQLNPTSAITYNNLGCLYESMGQLEKALESYNTAITTNGKYVRAYNNRACLYEKMGAYDKSKEDLEKALTLDPMNTSCYINRGYINHVFGDVSAALEDYTTAIRVNPKESIGYNNRSCLYNYFGEYQKAIDDSNSAIKLHAKEASAYAHRGFAKAQLGIVDFLTEYLHIGMLGEAMVDLEMSLQLNSKYPRVYAYKGLVLFKLNKIEEALEMCAKCIAISPKEVPDVYFIRGNIYKYLNQFSLSLHDFQCCCENVKKPRVFPIQLAMNMAQIVQSHLDK